MKQILIISIVLISILSLSIIEKQSKCIDTLKKERNELKRAYFDKSERLTKYYLISIEQSKIIDKFQSSRNELKNNKELINLMSEL